MDRWTDRHVPKTITYQLSRVCNNCVYRCAKVFVQNLLRDHSQVCTHWIYLNWIMIKLITPREHIMYKTIDRWRGSVPDDGRCRRVREPGGNNNLPRCEPGGCLLQRLLVVSATTGQQICTRGRACSSVFSGGGGQSARPLSCIKEGQGVETRYNIYFKKHRTFQS